MTPNVTAIARDRDTVYAAKTLLLTYPGRTWLKAGDLVTDSILPPLDPAAGDLKQDSFITALQLTRQFNNREQRIVICAGSDFISNLRLDENNLYFIRSAFSWLTYNHFPVEIPLVFPDDVLLNIGEQGAKVQKILFIWVLPSLIFVTGTILLIRRKRK